ncbi:MAG: N-acetylmuramoyl-L-alanine amidase [Clostridiales bacterium]|nr:N-acetylmuramoyl-L-alanine amidase [Clostridiales bacterium]
MAATIYIAAGHGGSDPGACAGVYVEKLLTLKTALACREYLKDYNCGVIMARTADKGCTVAHKMEEVEQKCPSLVLEIHYNAGGGEGCEVYYWHNHAPSKALAQAVLSQMTALGQIDTGDIVQFAGGKVYGSSTATAAASTRGASKCKVTATAPDARHPYHLISQDGKGVYGWVDAAAIEQNGGAAPVQPDNRYQAGRKIALSNASLYASSTAKTATRKLSGTYYLYDGKTFSGRYRITPRADMVGKTPVAGCVTGYIGQADIPPL